MALSTNIILAKYNLHSQIHPFLMYSPGIMIPDMHLVK